MKSVVSSVYRQSASTQRVANVARFQSVRGRSRQFHTSNRLLVVKPYLLADIGEGITECQVIQWFVKPGARVEQFDPICEVQSDKASVEITSRFDGVIKKLYYEPDDMAKVGKPLVDIDIQGDISDADAALLNGNGEQAAPSQDSAPAQPQETDIEVGRNDTKAVSGDIPSTSTQLPTQTEAKPARTPGKYASLAVPAVRHLIKELNLTIEDIEGTGKDGRVTKEDVHRHAQALKSGSAPAATTPAPTTPTPAAIPTAQDRPHPLTPIQSAMYKTMTKSLSIPHFLYSDAVDMSSLNTLRKKYNKHVEHKSQRLTPLPFIVKAVSLAFQEFPLLNAHLDAPANGGKPTMVLKGAHHIGIACDSPSGLLVPVIRDVQNHSIASLSAEISRLANLARDGKLGNADLTGATFTVSNIGSIGGAAVSPVIVSPQVGILGVGKARAVPAFGKDGEIIKKEEAVFSWSADHRVIDGAYAARCAERVRQYLEGAEQMLIKMR